MVNSRKVWNLRRHDTVDAELGSDRHVKVLDTCRFLLKFLHLCNQHGVQIKLSIFGGVEIPNFITFSAFAAPIVYELIMLIWACFSDDITKDKVPILTCVIFSNLQAVLTYTSMVRTNKFTIETIEFIQEVVNKSEFSLPVFEYKQENREEKARCNSLLRNGNGLSHRIIQFIIQLNSYHFDFKSKLPSNFPIIDYFGS